MSDAWVTRGFEDFRKGRFGNAGQNLYVSRAGVLQRIHQFDLTGNGYVDLVFCNSQSHWEQPPSLVYRDPLGSCERLELPSFGAWTGAVADLNGDGWDDLVLGFFKDGVHPYLNAIVYYGSPEGLTSRFHLQLPAPECKSAAIGDFMGTGKPAIAFLTGGHVRVFYQTPIGFEMKSYVDTDITGDQLCAADLDGDGYSDLVVRSKDGTIAVFWGGVDGIDPGRSDPVPFPEGRRVLGEEPDEATLSLEEYVADASPIPKVVLLEGKPHIYGAFADWASLVPVSQGREFGSPVILKVPKSLSVAVGDINGNGSADLVLACRDSCGEGEISWIYWGGDGGYEETRRTQIYTRRACDLAVGDLNGNGFADVVVCQNRTSESFTTESLIFRGCPEGIQSEPLHLVSHDARRVFIARTSSEEKPQIILISNFARSASDDNMNTVYFGSADGFSKADSLNIRGWGSYAALYADLNDNGSPDLVVTSGSEFSPDSGVGSYLFFGGPTGISREPDRIIPSVRAKSVVCADLTRNGYLDLAFSGADYPYVVVFYGGPDGYDLENSVKIRLEWEDTVIENPFGLFLADLDNDDWLDLIVAGMTSPRSLILWGGPEGFSMENCQPLAVLKGRNIQAADLTGNGYLDLVIAAHKQQFTGPHDSFLSIYWNGPGGIREDRKMMLQVKCANGFAIADFDNDGRLDIFAGAYSDSRERDMESYIYWNREGRGFSHWDRQCLQTHAVAGCLACDFDEDGWIDLAVANHKVLGDHKGYSEVWWNGPCGFSSERTTKLPTIGARGPVIVHPGNIVDRGPEEYYESVPFRLPDGANVRSIGWEAVVPQKTWVMAQLRSASTEDALDGLEWSGPKGSDSWYENGARIKQGNRRGRWIQYRLALGAVNSCRTPMVTEVRVSYV